MLYKAVDKMVLLYGSESWVMTGTMVKVLEGFHHQEDQRIAVMTSWSAEDRELEYTPVDTVL